MSEENLNSPFEIYNPNSYPLPFSETDVNLIIQNLQKVYSVTFAFVEIVYVNETEIVELNQKHLQRDYVTDIISFRYDESENDDKPEIEGTLFCCAPRISEQAIELGESESQEFKRIIIHGLLHLIGFEDNTTQNKDEMTDLENHFLALLS